MLLDRHRLAREDLPPARVAAVPRIHRRVVCDLVIGDRVEALAAARGAWLSGDLSQYDEQLIFSRFGSQLTAADHDRRIDALLFDKKASDAYRMLPYTTPTRRGAFGARIAMQSRAAEDPSLQKDVEKLRDTVGLEERH